MGGETGAPARRGGSRALVGRDREAAELAAGLDDAAVLGSASFYLGLLAAVVSRREEAGIHYEAALRAHDQLGAGPLLARTRYEYARMPRRGQAADHGSATDGNVFRQQGEYWTVAFEGSVAHLKDSKGLRHLARLLAHPGREFHAVDLEAADSQAAQPEPPAPRDRAGGDPLEVRTDLGDSGELLDAAAKAAYKARLDELRAELAEAAGFNDPARATQARKEMDFLVSELARAVGLGGRDRRAASHAEPARLNATRAVRAAMANLARANPSLGRHLAATIRTGQYCSYTRDPRVPVAWEV